MARIRTIKPEFFTSEDTCALSPLARLLYIALWCESDKKGRLVWKPATFKLRYLPGDAIDITTLCQELLSRGVVVLYGEGLAYIPSFELHQHINPRESESKLPNPSEIDALATRADASIPELHPQVGREGKGKEGKEIKAHVASDAADLLGDPSADEKVDTCPHQKIIALYHEVLPQCPRVRDWTPARATQLRARWNEDPSRQNLDYWRRFFEYVSSCGFLVGVTTTTAQRPFFADLEWMTKSANFTKIREQKYESR